MNVFFRIMQSYLVALQRGIRVARVHAEAAATAARAAAKESAERSRARAKAAAVAAATAASIEKNRKNTRAFKPEPFLSASNFPSLPRRERKPAPPACFAFPIAQAVRNHSSQTLAELATRLFVDATPKLQLQKLKVAIKDSQKRQRR